MNRPDVTSRTDSHWTLLFAAWIIASVSTLGSIFFSSVMDLPPCALCWYQRICLFPLVVILPAGMFPLSKDVFKFAFPLTLAGWGISVYHNLLYAGVIPKSLEPCGKGISCAEETVSLFGFVTIPLMSFIAFSTLAALLLVFQRRTAS